MPSIELTDYEAANLREVLRTIIGATPQGAPPSLGALFNGDWNGSVLWKLDELDIDYKPNKTAQQMDHESRSWLGRELEVVEHSLERLLDRALVLKRRVMHHASASEAGE